MTKHIFPEVLTKEEFLKKYKDVKFYFHSYEKYTFHYVGKLDSGESVLVWCCGNYVDAYQFDVLVDHPENIYNIDPSSGIVTGKDGDKFST